MNNKQATNWIVKWLALPILGLCTAAATIAVPTTINFDDIGTLDVGFIEDGYHGFDWNNFAYVKNSLVTGSGFDNGTISGEYAAFNAFAGVATASDAVFDFNSAYLTAATHNGLNITITGALDGLVLFTDTIIVNTYAATLFEFDYLGIDSLEFSAFGGVDAGLNTGYASTLFVIDDLTYTRVDELNVNAVSVPEPGLLALLGSGLLLITLLRNPRLPKVNLSKNK